MTQRVIIEGNLVRIVEEKEVKQASLEEFLPLLTTRQPIHIPGLPRNMSHLGVDPKPNGESEVDVVIECEPRPRNIAYTPDDQERHIKNYKLAMPWTYFVFNMHTADPALKGQWTCRNWHVYWSKTRVTSLDHAMSRAWLPNCYADGRICFGNLGRAGNTTLAEFVDGTVNTFWISTFNNHLRNALPGGYKTFDEWAAATTQSEACWENWPELNQMSCLLRQALRQPAERFAPIVVEGTIPNIPMPMTFEVIDQWFGLLDDTNKQRMRDYVGGAGQYTLRPRT